MRIPRTNFHPATSDTTISADERDPNTVAAQDHPWPGEVPYAPVWTPPADAGTGGETSRFRSPILRASDPTHLVDGSLNSHFLMAPNVRFTRTPDREPQRDIPAAVPVAAVPVVAMPVVALPVVTVAETAAALPAQVTTLAAQGVELAQPSPVAVEIERLREAMSERRMMRWKTQAHEPAPDTAERLKAAPPVAIAPENRLIEPLIVPATPSLPIVAEKHQPYLSDFAFFESANFDFPEPAVVTPVVAAPMPAVDSGSIAAKFRVVEVRKSPAQPAPAAIIAATPVAAIPPASFAPAPHPTVRPANVVVTPAVPEPSVVRQTTSSGVAISKPFQIPQSTLSMVSGDSYAFPPRDLLQEAPQSSGFVLTQEQLEQNAGHLESVLEDFGVRGEIIHVRPGPVVTLYEFEPAPGVKSSRVIGLADDIARSMSAVSARVAVVPGRNVIGIDLPNAHRETVYFRELIDSPDFNRTAFKLPLCLGKTIGGEPVIAELAKMPHLLVAGTTGSGKSVAINTMILSLLYRLTPEECRLIMVDPKMLELSIYDGIPHLLTPVVTDPKKAVMALKWAVKEMEDRYRKMSKLGVRNIDGYNARAAAAREKGETFTTLVQTGFEKGTGEAIHQEQDLDLTRMPYIVVIVDEMADLMMVAGKEIEGAIQRLAQMARAAGIHLIMATQRPSVDVITGTIKANFPTRISFQVTSKIDSRTILGEQGAEQLLGQGDMLHMAGGGRIVRVHGPFVSDEEVENVVAHLRTQGRPEYLDTVTATDEEPDDADDKQDKGAVFDKGDMAAEDSNDLYDKAVKVVLRDKKCSTSYIQRRLGIGYNRAASLVERMEKEGLVGSANHVGKREIVSNSADRPLAAFDSDMD
ncbi:DNA translocase FtsK [Pararhizobium antarcticum]|uniref:Cell division protein FtsK n=1 Tax=Pararhizobium antarcticum TaxID=1798805 RepID=A0A657LVS4_9HYPH|nr:DNA translocase FtsK [Pararhizobium antarcticum]OJF98355.1 cell division protein FtsK [Pararhizobium antarcticum]